MLIAMDSSLPPAYADQGGASYSGPPPSAPPAAQPAYGAYQAPVPVAHVYGSSEATVGAGNSGTNKKDTGVDLEDVSVPSVSTLSGGAGGGAAAARSDIRPYEHRRSGNAIVDYFSGFRKPDFSTGMWWCWSFTAVLWLGIVLTCLFFFLRQTHVLEGFPLKPFCSTSDEMLNNGALREPSESMDGWWATDTVPFLGCSVLHQRWPVRDGHHHLRANHDRPHQRQSGWDRL